MGEDLEERACLLRREMARAGSREDSQEEGDGSDRRYCLQAVAAGGTCTP
jgi:hypothetical protein